MFESLLVIFFFILQFLPLLHLLYVLYMIWQLKLYRSLRALGMKWFVVFRKRDHSYVNTALPRYTCSEPRLCEFTLHIIYSLYSIGVGSVLVLHS